MHLDPTLVIVVGVSFAVIAVGLVLDYLKQPLVITYLLVGIVLGPGVFGLVQDAAYLGPLGSMGLVFLLFFVGMEIRPVELIKSWRVAVIGTLLQVLGSCLAVWAIGWYFDWTLARIVLLGFVVSLSSTAIVVKMLQDSGELSTDLGQDVLGILLVQDLVIVPMMIILGLLGGEQVGYADLVIQIVAAIVIVVLVIWVLRHPGFTIPGARFLKDNHELEVFGALAICLGFAFITGSVGLSSVLGAFVAGICVSAAKETQWFHESLQPFHVLLVACFFLSVGLMLDLQFVLERWHEIVFLVAAVFFTNILINASIMRVLGLTWKQSFYGGSMLSQIGEFSFVLAAIGFAGGIINEEGYQLVVATIVFSLIFSPLLIGMMRRVTSTGLSDRPAGFTRRK
ncbi:MAG: CPA2 family monovalent cation:H+ antiporter-2 [Granulosicoccus sp.]|jgi:CPA2 family monovalent cation:H+ antiporter-2